MCVGEGLSPAGYVENASGSKQSAWRALGSTYLDVGIIRSTASAQSHSRAIDLLEADLVGHGDAMTLYRNARERTCAGKRMHVSRTPPGHVIRVESSKKSLLLLDDIQELHFEYQGGARFNDGR